MTMNRTLAAWVAGLGVWAVALMGLAAIEGPSATLDRTVAELEAGSAAARSDTTSFVVQLAPEVEVSTESTPALRTVGWPDGSAPPSTAQQMLPELRF